MYCQYSSNNDIYETLHSPTSLKNDNLKKQADDDQENSILESDEEKNTIVEYDFTDDIKKLKQRDIENSYTSIVTSTTYETGKNIFVTLRPAKVLGYKIVFFDRLAFFLLLGTKFKELSVCIQQVIFIRSVLKGPFFNDVITVR